jgi:NAD(P)-dependent dehydrogenase (short-subunit alcohol dehydrogenase family)
MQLSGKTAVITGGTTGIGFATAKLFLAQGARVTITGQDSQRLADAAKALGKGAQTALVDVRKPADLLALATQIQSQYGSLDVLFANAGLAFATPVGITTAQRFDINCKGVFFTVQPLVPLMPRGGSIVLNTSWLDPVGTAGLSLLSASKAAVRSNARSLSAE